MKNNCKNIVSYAKHDFLITEHFDIDNKKYFCAKSIKYPNIIGGGDTQDEAIKECFDNLLVYLEYLAEEIIKNGVCE